MNKNKCKKRRYKDKIAAMLVLAKIGWKDSSKRNKKECRAYKCNKCHGWHLTSHEAYDKE